MVFIIKQTTRHNAVECWVFFVATLTHILTMTQNECAYFQKQQHQNSIFNSDSSCIFPYTDSKHPQAIFNSVCGVRCVLKIFLLFPVSHSLIHSFHTERKTWAELFCSFFFFRENKNTNSKSRMIRKLKQQKCISICRSFAVLSIMTLN